MSYIKITLNGRDVVQGQINQRIDVFIARVGNAVQGAGIDTEAGAKQRCPVDTGRLRASILYQKITELSCKIGTNVKYAKFIEFGTHKSRAQPYMFPAHLVAKKNLITELKSLVI